MERKPKPSGWKGKRTDHWWTKDTVYGVKYKCPYCGKESLGMVWGKAQETMHRGSCPMLGDPPTN